MNFIYKWRPLFALAVSLLAVLRTPAQTAPDADAIRLKAIAEFTQKMKDANLPPLFDKAAAEFHVPPDVLKAVSFAETRWSNLQWPPGETASPDTGMPHSYGIMSLWDNEHFGHNLIQAANLIGQDPEVLKTDVYQNMRGGAALLRKLYDETPKPADAPGDEIESWRKAIVKYTGIPEPELSELHTLRVYEYMNLGYHQYGIEWDAHPVNLGPMRAEVAKIRAEAQARRNSTNNTEATLEQPTPTPPPVQPPPTFPAPATNVVVSTPASPAPSAAPAHAADASQRGLLLGLIILLLGIGLVYVLKRRSKPA